MVSEVVNAVCFIELEVGGSAEEFAHTLRLFDTRKFEKDLTIALHLLDVRRNNTEAVDTSAKHIV